MGKADKYTGHPIGMYAIKNIIRRADTLVLHPGGWDRQSDSDHVLPKNHTHKNHTGALQLPECCNYPGEDRKAFVMHRVSHLQFTITKITSYG